LLPPWFVAVTAVIFVGGAVVLALTCRPAERIEKWGGAFLNPPEPDATTGAAKSQSG
jgi:hypothetical protein